MESWTHFLKITALNLKSRITDFATVLIIKKDLSYKSKGPVCSEVTLYTLYNTQYIRAWFSFVQKDLVGCEWGQGAEEQPAGEEEGGGHRGG